jgi:hypothetical protein
VACPGRRCLGMLPARRATCPRQQGRGHATHEDGPCQKVLAHPKKVPGTFFGDRGRPARIIRLTFTRSAALRYGPREETRPAPGPRHFVK